MHFKLQHLLSTFFSFFYSFSLGRSLPPLYLWFMCPQWEWIFSMWMIIIHDASFWICFIFPFSFLLIYFFWNLFTFGGMTTSYNGPPGFCSISVTFQIHQSQCDDCCQRWPGWVGSCSLGMRFGCQVKVTEVKETPRTLQTQSWCQMTAAKWKTQKRWAKNFPDNQQNHEKL